MGSLGIIGKKLSKIKNKKHLKIWLLLGIVVGFLILVLLLIPKEFQVKNQVVLVDVITDLVNPAYLKCKRDSDCVGVLPPDCARCRCSIAINKKYKEIYLQEIESRCKDYQGLYCEMMCPTSAEFRCISSKCFECHLDSCFGVVSTE